jgi:hypothetical protein
MSASGETNPRPAVITNIPGTPAGGEANAHAYASLPRKYNPLMKLNNSPNGSPSLRNRRASMNRAFSLMIILARTPPAFAGERRKIRWATRGCEAGLACRSFDLARWTRSVGVMAGNRRGKN